MAPVPRGGSYTGGGQPTLTPRWLLGDPWSLKPPSLVVCPLTFYLLVEQHTVNKQSTAAYLAQVTGYSILTLITAAVSLWHSSRIPPLSWEHEQTRHKAEDRPPVHHASERQTAAQTAARFSNDRLRCIYVTYDLQRLARVV